VKLKLVDLAMISAFFFIGVNQSLAGTIKFTGEIVDSSCTVVEGDNQDIDLGGASKTEMATAGNETTPRNFSINLSGCPANYEQISLTFNGESDDDDGKLIKSTGDAKGVGIALYDMNSAQSQLDISKNPQTDTKKTDASGVTRFDFSASIKASGTPVEPGSVAGVANYTINYK
jgi:major type 1 subunit fimbrin (pilin)